MIKLIQYILTERILILVLFNYSNDRNSSGIGSDVLTLIHPILLLYFKKQSIPIIRSMKNNASSNGRSVIFHSQSSVGICYLRTGTSNSWKKVAKITHIHWSLDKYFSNLSVSNR